MTSKWFERLWVSSSAKCDGVVSLLTLIWPILKGGIDDLVGLFEVLGVRREVYQGVLVDRLFVTEVAGGVMEWLVVWLRGGSCN